MTRQQAKELFEYLDQQGTELIRIGEKQVGKQLKLKAIVNFAENLTRKEETYVSSMQRTENSQKL